MVKKYYPRIAKVFLICIVFTLEAQAQYILAAFPKPFQLYCRDAQDSAITAVSGTITEAGAESVSVTLYKNNNPLLRIATALQYSGNTASFNLQPKIHAELSMYKFELRIDASLVLTVDSVVCGDAFLIDGQSNSVECCDAVLYGTALPRQPFLRTFGTWTWDNEQFDDSERTGKDTSWGIAVTQEHWENKSDGPDVTGWGLQIAKRIMDNYSIPICVISGGVHGTRIEEHARSTSLNTIYGRYLWRIKKANLQDGLKWVIWHQGESDGGNEYVDYKTAFLSQCDSWKADFPNLKHYYLFQVRAGCGSPLELVSEQQRQVPFGRPDISIMSTVMAPEHDGCHFGNAGYAAFAEWMYPLVARDFYGYSDTVRNCPPNIQRAWFADEAHTVLTLRFDQPVIVPEDEAILNAFAVDNDVILEMDSVKADTSSNSITLFLREPSNAVTMSYAIDGWGGVSYLGPWLCNTRGIGALTFNRFPISQDNPNEKDIMLPENFILTALPNPFHPNVNIQVSGLESGTELRILDMNGRVVADLTSVLNSASSAKGVREVTWNAKGYASGVYLAVFQNGKAEVKRKVILIR